MKILFRIDAGGKIGLGHFYRSLTLAQELKKGGHEIMFTSPCALFWNKQQKEGFPFAYYALSEGNEDTEMLSLINSQEIDVFFVDGFIDFSEEFFQNVKQTSKVVFYQNNTNSRYLADVFILPSIHQGNNFFKPFTNNTRVFQGLKYFTFHPDIAKIPGKQELNKKVNSIAFAAGGSDPKDTLRKLYNQVLSVEDSDIHYFFYYGNNYLYKDSIPKKTPANIEFRPFSHQAIVNHDILVNAFGVSTYEFLFLGMPIISFGHQESTTNASQVLSNSTQAFIHIGDINKMDEDVLIRSIEELKSQTVRETYSKKAKELLDLDGPKRIVEIIQQPQ